MTGRHYAWFVEGKPPIKRRARGSHHYTPKETVADEKRIRETFLETYPVVRSERPFQVEIQIWCLMPRASKFSYPREDGDNIEKAVFDAMNTCLWEDDRQITSCIWFRRFATEDNPEGIYIKAHEL